MQETQKIPLSRLAAAFTHIIVSLGSLSCGCPYHMSERRVQIIKEHKQNADRTEKGIFGIFGVINTIKITNGKVSEVAFFGSHYKQKVFPFFFFSFFFCFFFFFPFLFCCFTRTLSSFLEAASVRVLSFWFMIFIYLSFIYFSSFRIAAPKSGLVTLDLSSGSESRCRLASQRLSMNPLCCSDSEPTAVPAAILNNKHKPYGASVADAQ